MDNNQSNNDDFSQALDRIMGQAKQILKQVADEVTVRMESADLDDLTRKAEEALGRTASKPSPAATAPEPAAATPPPADEPPAQRVSRFRDGKQVEDEPAAGKVSRFRDDKQVEDDAQDAADQFEELVQEAEASGFGFTVPPVTASAGADSTNDASTDEPVAEDEMLDEDLADRALALAEDIARRLNLPPETVDRIKAEGEKAAFTVAITVGRAQQKLEDAKGKLDEPTRQRLTELMGQAGKIAGQARTGGTGGAKAAAADFAAKTKKAQHEALLKKAEAEIERHKKDAAKTAAGLAASTALYLLLKAKPKP